MATRIHGVSVNLSETLTLSILSPKVSFKKLPLDDPKVRQPDISLALKTFKNWKPGK